MDFYKYKCSDCGSTRFEKTENGYKCKYCGNIQDVVRFEEKKEEKPQVEEVVQEQKNEQSHTKPSNIKVTEKFRPTLIRFMICLFGGWFGLHKFLKGEIFWGVIYAITGGLFGVGYVIDIICSAVDLIGTIKVGGEK